MRRLIDAKPAILYFSGHGAIIANEEKLVLHILDASADLAGSARI
jgi:hypothetical protein